MTSDDEPMAEVISMVDRRPAISSENLTCRCGSQWFMLRGRPGDPPALEHGAVVLRQDGSVSGYAGQPVCIECGVRQG